MRDLSAAIAAWRGAAHGLFRGREKVLDELEAHLWDTAERLCESGMSPAEAVRTAVVRLGATDAIAAEFDKVPAVAVPSWPARIAWICSALIAVSVAVPFIPRFAAGGLSAVLAAHVTAVTVGYAATVLVGCLSGWLLVTRLFREPKAGLLTMWRITAVRLSALAAVLTVVGIAFGTKCPFDKSGWCFGLDTREVGGIGIALWNVIAAFTLAKVVPRSRPALLVGVAGNAAVTIGWLAASHFEDQSYGLVNSFPTVAVLLTAIVGIGLTAFVPAGYLRLNR